ncbi:MAG: CDP-alcohol phosphatidyltransferase family protein [Promethearchaeota archaeon]
MPKERGLKRIYRYCGIGFSNLLFRLSKKLNPNLITISGFLIFFSGWLQYVIFYMFNEIVFLNKSIFIISIQIAIIIDYIDGEYARKINQCTKRGQYIDGGLDYLKILLTYVLIYYTFEDLIVRLLTFILLIIYSAFRWIRNTIHYESSKNIEKPKEGRFLSLSLIISFSIPHQFLYLSVFLIFGIWQILLLIIIIGIMFCLKDSVKLNKLLKKVDEMKQLSK